MHQKIKTLAWRNLTFFILITLLVPFFSVIGIVKAFGEVDEPLEQESQTAACWSIGSILCFLFALIFAMAGEPIGRPGMVICSLIYLVTGCIYAYQAIKVTNAESAEDEEQRTKRKDLNI